ncbi:MAG: hypothetical protein JWQ68_771 [Cryobacterium sp.]|nr:hypothetical protein [Cryobacterium sp.]
MRQTASTQHPWTGSVVDVMRNDSPPPSNVPVDLPIEARLTAAVERYGEAGVVERASALLAGKHAGEDFLLYAGGRHAQGLLDGAPALYWPELWGARTLLHVWNADAAEAVVSGLGNQSWRVREMCARVSMERRLEAVAELTLLTSDPVPRVRAAALRALGAVGESAQAHTIEVRLNDRDKDVRRAAQQSRDALRTRLSGQDG